jgi:hypothetical protein
MAEPSLGEAVGAQCRLAVDEHVVDPGRVLVWLTDGAAVDDVANGSRIHGVRAKHPRKPSATPVLKSSGVEGSLRVWMAPDSSVTTRSVNVPPTSTPTRAPSNVACISRCGPRPCGRGWLTGASSPRSRSSRMGPSYRACRGAAAVSGGLLHIAPPCVAPDSDLDFIAERAARVVDASVPELARIA